MINHLRSFFSQTTLYGLGTVTVRLLNYLLVPFYTSVLSDPAAYGQLSELYSYVALLNIVYLYGMETTLLRFYRFKGLRTKLFVHLQTLIICTTLCFSISLFFLADPITSGLGYHGQAYIIQILSLILATDALTALPFTRLRLAQKAALFVGLKVGGVVVNIALNICFLWLFPRIYQGALLTSLQPLLSVFYHIHQPVFYILLANLLANICWLPFFYKTWHLRWPTSRLLRKYIRFGWPLMGTGLIGAAIEALPRVLFRHLSPLEHAQALRDFGVYSASAKLAVCMLLVLQAYRYAVEPFLLSASENKRNRKLFAQLMHGLLSTALIALVGISLHIDLLGDIFLRQSSYQEALSIVPLLLAAHILFALYYHFSLWFKRLGRTYYGWYFSLGGLSIALLLTLYLVPLLSYHALPIAMAGAYLCMCLSCYLVGQHKYYVPYSWRDSFIYIVVAWALVLGFSPVSSWQIFGHTSLILRILLWILYIVCVCSIQYKKELAKLMKRDVNQI